MKTKQTTFLEPKQFTTSHSEKIPIIDKTTDEIMSKQIFKIPLKTQFQKNVVDLYSNFLEKGFTEIVDRRTVVGGIVEAAYFLTHLVKLFDVPKQDYEIDCIECLGGSFNAVFICTILSGPENTPRRVGNKFVLRILFNDVVPIMLYEKSYSKISKDKDFEKYFAKPIVSSVDFMKSHKIGVETYWMLMHPLKEIERLNAFILHDYLDTILKTAVVVHRNDISYRDWKIFNMMLDDDDRMVLSDIEFVPFNSKLFVSTIEFQALEEFIFSLGIMGKDLTFAVDNIVGLVSYIMFKYYLDTGNEWIFDISYSMDSVKRIPAKLKALIKKLANENKLADTVEFSKAIKSLEAVDGLKLFTVRDVK